MEAVFLLLLVQTVWDSKVRSCWFSLLSGKSQYPIKWNYRVSLTPKAVSAGTTSTLTGLPVRS